LQINSEKRLITKSVVSRYSDHLARRIRMKFFRRFRVIGLNLILKIFLIKFLQLVSQLLLRMRKDLHITRLKFGRGSAALVVKINAGINYHVAEI
jgi:hypothetical protein